MVRLGRGYPISSALIHRQPSVVTFDTVSGLLLDGFAAVSSQSWSLNVGSNDNCVVVAASLYWDNTPSGPTATLGGTSMTRQSMVYAGNDTTGQSGRLTLFTLLNPPTGTQTIVVTIPGTSGTSGGVFAAAAYAKVGTVGTPVTNFGTGTALTSNSVTQSTNGLIVHSFYSAARAAITSYNQTSRYANHITSATNSNFASLVLGDDATPGGQSFTGTCTSAAWSSVALPLSP